MSGITKKLIKVVEDTEMDMECVIALRDLICVNNRNVEGIEVRQRLSEDATVHDGYYSFVPVVLGGKSRTSLIDFLNNIIKERQRALKQIESALKGEIPLSDVL